MAARRLSMRKIKEVLRLEAEGLSSREVARSCSASDRFGRIGFV